MNSRTSLTIALLVAGGLAVSVSGCSTGSSASTTAADAGSSTTDKAPNELSGIDTPAEYDEKIAKSVPEEYRDGLTVGTDATMAPKEFLAEDGKTFTGLDIDFTYAIGNVLGVKMNFVNAGFDTLLPGVQNGRYDFVASSAAPTLEREKVVDFVSVDRSGESLLTKKADADSIKDIESLCGRVAGAIKGSLQVEDLAEQSDKCVAAGDKAIETSLFPDASAVNLALKSSRVDVAFFDTPTSAYQAKNSHGDLVVVGPIYRAGLEGVFMKQGGGLAEPVAAAVNELIESGTYQELLDKWGLSDSAIETAYVNPATNGKADE
jgi:polar amino acid transport system substrate-binding protein